MAKAVSKPKIKKIGPLPIEETLRVKEKHLVWELIQTRPELLALIMILGGFFLAVKGLDEGSLFAQIAGGLFLIQAFVMTRVLKLLTQRE